MISGYPYVAMLVTGCLHLALGIGGCALAIIGITRKTISVGNNSLFMFYYSFASRHHQTLYGVAILCSVWIILIGCLGIAAGVSKLEERVTRGLKTAYMVTAILSACIFSLVGSAMFTLTNPVASWFYNRSMYFSVYIGGVSIMGLEFILAIVSSSICCCCSSERIGAVVVQAPPQTVHTIQPYGPQYQMPPTQTFPGLQVQIPAVQNYYGTPYQQQSYPLQESIVKS